MILCAYPGVSGSAFWLRPNGRAVFSVFSVVKVFRRVRQLPFDFDALRLRLFGPGQTELQDSVLVLPCSRNGCRPVPAHGLHTRRSRKFGSALVRSLKEL